MKLISRIHVLSAVLFLILFFLLSANSSFAETKTFVKEYTYQASEYDSKVTCRTLALEQVKRLLLEELGIYLESETEVKNLQLTKDQIITITAGIVHASVIDEKWDGKAYYLTAKIEANPKEVEANIYAIRQDRQKMKQIEELSKTIAEQSQQIEKLKKELNKSSRDTKKIKKYNEAVKKLEPTNFFESGDALLFVGKYEEALAYFNRLIKLNHKDAKAYLGRAQAYMGVGDYQKALKDFNQSINLNPRNGYAYFSRGQFYLNMKEYGKATSDFSKAIDLSKGTNNKQGFLYARGVVYDVMGEYQKAIIDFDKCIELDKDYPDDPLLLRMTADAYEGRANVFFHLGNYNQAIKEFGKAIDLKPLKSDLYSMRGLAYSKSGNPQLAVIDYDKVIEVDENNERTSRDALAKMGIPYERKPKIDVYTTYLRRAFVYGGLDDINREIADYTSAIGYDPMKPDAYFFRGYAYYLNGDKGKGVEDFKTAARLGYKEAQDFLRKQDIAW